MDRGFIVKQCLQCWIQRRNTFRTWLGHKRRIFPVTISVWRVLSLLQLIMCFKAAYSAWRILAWWKWVAVKESYKASRNFYVLSAWTPISFWLLVTFCTHETSNCNQGILYILSGGEIPHQPLSLPHQWNIFAPPLKCPFESTTFLLLYYLKNSIVIWIFRSTVYTNILKVLLKACSSVNSAFIRSVLFSNAPPVKNS